MRLTSDLHGGCGTKLTIGLLGSTIGRPVYVPAPPAALDENGSMRPKAREFIQSLLLAKRGWRANHALERTGGEAL